MNLGQIQQSYALFLQFYNISISIYFYHKHHQHGSIDYTERERQRDYVLRPSQAHVSMQNCSASECILTVYLSLDCWDLLLAVAQ